MQGICAATAVPKLSILPSVHGLSSSLCKSSATTLSGRLLRSSKSSFFSFRRPHCFVENTSGSGHKLGFRRLRVVASSSAGPYDTDGGNRLPSDLEKKEDTTLPLDQPKRKRTASLQAVAGVAALIGVGTLGGVAVTLANGGPTALMAAIAKSGFSAAFALVFVSEIGDKTFFIAALLAMQYSRLLVFDKVAQTATQAIRPTCWLVMLGATGALSLMTVISVIIGRVFHSVPQQLQSTLPIGEYAAVALLVWFGFRSIKAAWDLPPDVSGTPERNSESGELAEAQEFLEKSEAKKASTGFEVVSEAFSLVFVAEWGDRSMLATVALGAAQSPWGVTTGAIAGHVLATALAVLGGAFLAQYISEKWVGYTGGVLFLIFAAATLLGVF